MKYAIKVKPETVQFKPVTVQLEIESIEELRLLYLVFRSTNLGDILCRDHALANLNNAYAENFSVNAESILNEITEQGFSLI